METMHGVLSGLTSATAVLLELVEANRRGRPLGLPSVCSADRFVLEAAVRQASRDETLVLIESTCNQVNQLGGYTGMRPADFAARVADVARAAGYPLAGLVLGGDHLGPYPWRDEPAGAAMAKAGELVRACVLAGYTKIHLDCSMRLADDPGGPGDGLSDETAARRTAQLAEVSESARREVPAERPAPLYVVGTEVPTPGGEVGDDAGPGVTTVAHVERTWELCASAFGGSAVLRAAGALDRVIALVVQPGVEFGPDVVHDYRRSPATRDLSGAVEDLPHLVYEAHSTDYQTPAALRALVEDHFAVLKVGPSLTFAAREALFALDAIERELHGGPAQGAGPPPSALRETLERVMTAHPEHWRDYYGGDAQAQRLSRQFAYSDRVRYYWAQPEVAAAVDRLIAVLAECPIPPTLLSQYLPDQARAVRAGELPARPSPVELVRHKVLTVLDDYAAACGMR